MNGTAETMEARIRETYLCIADDDGWGEPDWVSLTDLRGHLGAYPRAAVDEALIRMEQDPDVHLVPEADQKRLTVQDREAAVVIGGVRKHMICIR